MSPACTNCRRAKPPKQCVFGGVKIRHSSYATKSRDESKATDAARPRPVGSSCEQEMIFQPPLDTTSVTSVHRDLATSPPGSSKNLSVSEPRSSASRPLWRREHESPQSNASPGSSLVHSLSPRTYQGTFEPRGENYTVRSPSLDRSALAITSPTVSFNHLRRSGAPRLVTDSVEQYVFDFYVSKAGPWVSLLGHMIGGGLHVEQCSLTLLHLIDTSDRQYHDSH